MSILSQAFDNILNARQRVVGVREKVTLNGVPVDALVEQILFDDRVLFGGITEGGGYKCQIATDDVPSQPAQYSPITIRGETLQVLDVTDVNTVAYILTVGSPMKDSRG